ncbi:MAG: YceI family protein [Mameliella sp.]|nr:YceI family protein [Phaeodactylibacter sp.]
MDTTPVVSTTWGIDPGHSEIHFKVKHMMVSTITGAFNEFEGSLESESDDFENAYITFSANTESIDTKNKQRDQHLKSDDFFSVARFPKLTFQSKTFHRKSNGDYRLIGDLTIKGQKREIELDVAYNGTVIDLYGRTVAGFEISGLVNRKNFGLTWNAITQSGGFLVSENICLDINIQLIKQNREGLIS